MRPGSGWRREARPGDAWDDSSSAAMAADVPAADFHGRRGLRKSPAADTHRSIEDDDRAYRPPAAQRREALVDGGEADALGDQVVEQQGAVEIGPGQQEKVARRAR